MTVGVEEYKPSGAIHFIIGDSTEVLRISKEGITANPDVPVDEIAAKVLELLEQNIRVLVKRAVEAEREACAKVCEEIISECCYVGEAKDVAEFLADEIRWREDSESEQGERNEH